MANDGAKSDLWASIGSAAAVRSPPSYWWELRGWLVLRALADDIAVGYMSWFGVFDYIYYMEVDRHQIHPECERGVINWWTMERCAVWCHLRFVVVAWKWRTFDAICIFWKRVIIVSDVYAMKIDDCGALLMGERALYRNICCNCAQSKHLGIIVWIYICITLWYILS